MPSLLQLALSLAVTVLPNPANSFSHHKRPIVYKFHSNNMEHSEKVWKKPDFKQYLPQDFYYQNVKGGAQQTHTHGGVAKTFRNKKSQVKSTKSDRKLIDVDVSKSVRNTRKLQENMVVPADLDTLSAGHKAVKLNKQRDSFYETNGETHVAASEPDLANYASQFDPKYTSFLQKFLDTVNFGFWTRRNKRSSSSKVHRKIF